MSHVDGPPPVFEGDNFPYWKIRMEAYLEAIDVRVLRATTQGLPKPMDPANPIGDEANYEKWNAKAKNTLFRGFCKDVFYHPLLSLIITYHIQLSLDLPLL